FGYLPCTIWAFTMYHLGMYPGFECGAALGRDISTDVRTYRLAEFSSPFTFHWIDIFTLKFA
ncbi:MAG: hypothetical protein IJ609_03395, partial [Paludibacteraceae bacterium]|nr:hypothetical protein [Paludibacteraceae bacterium]